MNWLARLKRNQISPNTYPTKTTETLFVGFVGDPAGIFENLRAESVPANDPTADPDRWCWPNSEAMNSSEINTFMVRVRQFREQGLSESEAEVMADAMLKRDREGDLCDSPINGLPGASTPQPAPTLKLRMDSQQPPDTPTSCNGGSKANPFTIEPGAWRPLAQAYLAHHFGCPVCVAAGLGYGLRCGADAALWVAYHDQPRDCGAGGQYP